MKLVHKSSILLASLFLISSNLNAEVFDGLDGKNFKHPPMGSAGSQPGGSAASTPMRQPEGPAAQGKVLETSSAAGYTYLLLEAGGKQFWVAGTQVTAKVGDTVSYVTNVTMHDFTSKSMKKTFDSIIFASSVSVVQ